MSIQFTCPSCDNPIEVDDEWAGHNVACPYCKNAVTAPTETTYEPAGPTVHARPASGLDHPPDATPTPQAGNPLATWGFAVSLAAVVSFVAGSLVFGFHVVAELGENAAPEEVKKLLYDTALSDNLPPPWLMAFSALSCFGVVLWLVGLVLSVIGLRRTVRRGFAVAGLVLSCVLPMLIVLNVLAQ